MIFTVDDGKGNFLSEGAQLQAKPGDLLTFVLTLTNDEPDLVDVAWLESFPTPLTGNTLLSVISPLNPGEGFQALAAYRMPDGLFTIRFKAQSANGGVCLPQNQAICPAVTNSFNQLTILMSPTAPPADGNGGPPPTESSILLPVGILAGVLVLAAAGDKSRSRY